MSKKAQGLSMSTIIIAVLAILVLVLLVYILTDGFTKFSWTTTTCEGLGSNHMCADSCEGLEGDWTEKTAYSGTNGKCAEDEVCCMKVS